MPAITTTIDRDQREGLYELVRNHLGGMAFLERSQACCASRSPRSAWLRANCAGSSPS